MIELREPYEELINIPVKYTRHITFPDPRNICIYDDTLRDGEQMPGVAFSPEQKLELAIFLSELGVHVMDVAFPAISHSEQEALKRIIVAQRQGKIKKDVEILVMCRAVRQDIDCAVTTVKDAGGEPTDISLLILSTFSDLHMKYKLGRTLLKSEGRSESKWLEMPVEFYREANLKLITSVIRYARDKGFERIEFAAEDASRSNVDYGLVWAESCIRAGGTRMCFSDTCGVLTPEGVDYYIPRFVTALTPIPVTAHFHNDFGLGAINTIRAVHHGALYAGVTANGIGECSGNTSIHQFVMALKYLYGVTLPGFRYDLLLELKKKAEKISGVIVSPNEPIIGSGFFSHESGIHTAAITIHPAIYQFVREEEIGGKQRFVFGKHSGTAAIEAVLHKNKEILDINRIKVTSELIKWVNERVKIIRDELISTGWHERIVDWYNEGYSRLGISEEALLRLVLEKEEWIDTTERHVNKFTC